MRGPDGRAPACRGRRRDRHRQVPARGRAARRQPPGESTRATGGPDGRRVRPLLRSRLTSPPATCCAPVETAGWCWAEGRAVARDHARACAAGLPGGTGAARRRWRATRWPRSCRSGVAGDGRDAALARAPAARQSGAARGRLALRVDGAEVCGRSVTLLPERRLLCRCPARRRRRGGRRFAEDAG